MTHRLPISVRKHLERFEASLTSNGVFIAIIAVVLGTALLAAIITGLNAKHYWATYSFCIRVDCFQEAQKAFGVQISLIKAGAATAAFIAIILGAYIALRDYISSQQVGAFGNKISHVALFERFVAIELQRRKMLTPSCVDIYAIYQLMFPKTSSDYRYSSPEFGNAIRAMCAAISESSLEHSTGKDFAFEKHRRRMILAASQVHIKMDDLPRIDFLQVEDQVLDFLKMLCLVFAPPGQEVSLPQRTYR